MTEVFGRILVSNYRIIPSSYQLVALTKVLENGLGGLLIADGVGVGKTISSSYIAKYMMCLLRKPALIVCPPTLIPKWLEELKFKFEIKAFPIRALEDLETAYSESKISSSKVHAYVMSNSVLNVTKPSDFPLLSVVIYDEIHTYRNQETRAFQACLGLSPKADFRIGLSATPINNSLNDLVSELNILLPQFEWLALQSAVEEVWSFEPDKLNLPFVTRFTKNKLGIQFARRIVTSHLTKYQTDYVERVKSFIKNISRNRNRRGTFFEEISYFRMAASSPYTFFRALGSSEWKKYPNPKLTILKNIISSAQLSHWLIFCEFEDTIFHLEQNLTNLNCFTLTGKTPMSERPAIIESFRKTPNSVMMMTSVGSEGLDLQFCNGIINYDIHWNPMRLEQRFGRIDRVGQKKAEVIAHNIIVQGSLDERVVRVILRKLNMIHDSIFVPDSILGELPPLEKSQGLFNEDTLSKELGTSKKFLTMLQSNEDFQSYDYDILSLINSDYCSPSVLNVSATEWPKHTKWLLDKPVSSDWINKLKRYSMEFEKIIKYYS